MNRIPFRCFFLAMCLCECTGIFADSAGSPSLDIGGLFFGDLYLIPSHHLDTGEGAAGLVLRRGYLTLDADLTRRTFGRARLELNQSGEFETYTFDTRVKDLYLGWDLGRHRLITGLTSTMTYDLIESIWGFRYLARTPMDLQGVPSRDTGISLRGPLNSQGTLNYRAMVGSGLEFEADSSATTKWMGALTWKPDSRWTFDLYADFQDLKGTGTGSTVQAFAAYQGESMRWGLQYSNQRQDERLPIELASGFFVRILTPGSRLVTRIDRLLKPSARGNNISYLPIDPSATATLFFGGIEFQLTTHVSIIPNTVVTLYDRNDQGVRPDADMYLRLTLFANFE